MPSGLAWPPKKEDLEKLYVIEKLSAAKIASIYDLRYKNPKVGESTILYQLKKNGIARRGPADHVKKVTEEMVDDWVGRYQAGESLKRIAGEFVDPVTVWNHLKAKGVVLRDKVEAQIKAVTKYEKKPFSGDKIERAYLMGLRYGDLNAVRHGRAIRVRVSTTHPAMAELFESVFSPYAYVHRYPRKAKLVGHEWTLECDLDQSFEFLLEKAKMAQLEALPNEEAVAFLAGIFDAEGSILLHNKRGRFAPELVFSNTEAELLSFVKGTVGNLRLYCKISWYDQKEDRNGITGISREGQLVVWRFYDVQKLARILPLKHWEKVCKSVLVQEMEYRSPRPKNQETSVAWRNLLKIIEESRSAFIEAARVALGKKEERPEKGLV